MSGGSTQTGGPCGLFDLHRLEAAIPRDDRRQPMRHQRHRIHRHLMKLRMHFGTRAGLRVVASCSPLMHARAAKPIQDTLAAVRLGCTVAAAGFGNHGFRSCKARAGFADHP